MSTTFKITRQGLTRQHRRLLNNPLADRLWTDHRPCKSGYLHGESFIVRKSDSGRTPVRVTVREVIDSAERYAQPLLSRPGSVSLV